MIKIIEIVSGMNFGGVENLLFNYFSKMNLNNYSISIITHDCPNEINKKQFKNIGIEVYTVTSKRKNIFKNYFELKKLILRLKPDIVHCHMSLSSFMPLYIAKRCKVKLRICHAHEFGAKKSLSKKIFSKIIKQSSNMLMACSRDAAIYVYDKLDEVIILPNSIDIFKFKYDLIVRNNLRKRLRINDDEIIIGAVGRLVEIKNFKRLIDIFDECHCVNPKTKLLIIGDGILKEELSKYVKEKKLSDYIYFLGNVTDVNLYYNAMDIFIMTSFFEGLGLALIEAQANGLPAIVSDGFPAESIVNDNVMRLKLSDPNSKWINNIFKNLKRVNNEKIKKTKYNINNSVKILENIYKDCR